MLISQKLKTKGRKKINDKSTQHEKLSKFQNRSITRNNVGYFIKIVLVDQESITYLNMYAPNSKA